MLSPKVIILIHNINRVIINPIIIFLFVLATVIFLWGIVEFIWKSDSDTGRKEGQQHMLWGIIGIFLMLSVMGIINLFVNTFDIPADPFLQNVFQTQTE